MSEQLAPVYHLLTYKLLGVKIDVTLEADECDEPFHRFKHIRPIYNEDMPDMICTECVRPVSLVQHPSMEIPRWRG